MPTLEEKGMLEKLFYQNQQKSPVAVKQLTQKRNPFCKADTKRSIFSMCLKQDDAWILNNFETGCSYSYRLKDIDGKTYRLRD